MGLLDLQMPGLDTPQGQGLLAAAFNLMSAQKRPGQKGAIGSAIGDAGRTYMQTTNASKDAALKRKYMDMQMQEAQSQIEARRLAAAAAQQKQATLENIFGRSVSPGAFSPSIDGRGPTMPPQMAGGSGIGGMSIDQVAKLKAMAGVDLMDAYKWAKDPLKLDQGSTYVDRISGAREFMPKVDPGIAPDDNGFYGELPGYGAAQAGIEGAKARATEGARAALDLVSVPLSDGSTRMMPRSQAAQMLGGKQLPSAQQPLPRPQAGYSTPNPQETAAEQRRIVQSELDKETDPQTRAALSRELSRLGGGATLGATQTPEQIGQQKNITDAGGKVNDAWLKTSLEPVLASGQAAQAVIDSTNVARTAMRNMGGTGWGTEAKAGALNLLTGLGVAPKTAEMYASNAQIFQRSAMDRLWTTLNTAKGPQTEGDADRAAKTYGKLSNTPQANEFIFDLAQATAERDKMKAAFFKNALPIAQKSGDLMEVERQWDKRAPSIFEMPTMSKWGKK